MRLGLRAYLKQKLSKKSSYLSLGIAIGTDTVSFCVIRQNAANDLVLHKEKVVSSSKWDASLKKWVDEEQLQGTATYIAFSIGHYQQYQIDKPSVEPSELPEALKWSVNELAGTDDNRTIDYFDLPLALAGNEKINVVGLPNTEISQAVNATFSAGLRLENISVEEIVTCNLLMQEEDAVLSLIQDGSEEVCLNIVNNGNLYFSRRLKGFENLSSFSVDELNMGIIDSLCVQIQRSMDYFESQLRQAPVRKIQLKLNSQHLDSVKTLIEHAIPAQVSVMDAGVVVDEHINPYSLNYTAIGAALQARYPQAVSQ